jgi:hypothetical protein
VKPPPPTFNEVTWCSLCETVPVRPRLVAVGRARVAHNDWPEALAVADAVLAWPCRFAPIGLSPTA